VKPLEWGPEECDGGFYVSICISGDFSAFYQIDQTDFDLAEVSFGIVCHEFGSDVIWRGPKDDAKAAAQAHYAKQIIARLDL